MESEIDPNIFISEIKEAMKQLKLNRTPGVDGISTDIMNLLGDER